MNVDQLNPNESLPALITPNGSKDLMALARSERDALRSLTIEHGALLFRGFDVTTPAQFNLLCKLLADDLLAYTERSTPRSHVEGNVYTSTEYPPEATIPLHCEMAYTRQWPSYLWFYSHIAADEGGATPICDARKVYDAISSETRRRFEDTGGVMYVRNFRKGIDLSWQEVYGVQTESDLEAYCAEHNIDFEWRAGGVLRTRAVAQAFIEHPQTGARAWFNQAHLFHVSNLDAAIRKFLISKFGEDGLPRNSYYGDGSVIESEVLSEIRAAYAAAEVAFPWQRGDVLMVDNMAVSHGRHPFKGERKTFVAMAEAYPPT